MTPPLPKPEGLHEPRTRVTFFLPYGAREEKAIRSIIDYLQRQRKSRIAVTGFTQSIFPDTVFAGQWWSKKKKKWDRERVVLFVVDYDRHLGDKPLTLALGRLKGVIADRYKRNRKPQREIWLIAESARRYT